jgi:threonine dehydrogenase-like Zn-dependent dehydrogenase
VSDEKVIYLSDVLPTSYHSVVDTGVKEGDVVGIWGAGPIGLCAIRWAFLKGAKKVIVIDQVKERLDMAREAGAEVVDFTGSGADGKEPENKKIDVVEKMHQLSPGGLDVALDCGTSSFPIILNHDLNAENS